MSITMAEVLLVEDEALIGMMLADMVGELGHQVVAEAGDVVAGKSLAEVVEFDLAILGVNLHGMNSQPVAEMVAARGLPFFFVTGYGAAGLPEQFKDAPVVTKPFVLTRFQEVIDAVLAEHCSGR